MTGTKSLLNEMILHVLKAELHPEYEGEEGVSSIFKEFSPVELATYSDLLGGDWLDDDLGSHESVNGLIMEHLRVKMGFTNYVEEGGLRFFFRPGTGPKTNTLPKKLLSRVLEAQMDYETALTKAFKAQYKDKVLTEKDLEGPLADFLTCIHIFRSFVAELKEKIAAEDSSSGSGQ